MRATNLFAILSGIVTTVIAGASASATGCSEGLPSAGPGNDAAANADALASPFEDEASFGCTAPLAEVLTNLKPATPVDYVELRSEMFDLATGEPARDADAGAAPDAAPDAGEAPLLPTKSVATKGTPCATATSHDACLSALAALRIEKGQGWDLEPSPYGRTSPIRYGFLVYTRADEVGAATDAKTLASFLGTIDTLEEARLLMTTQGRRDLSCATTPFKSGWKRNEDGSWAILVADSDCGNPRQTLFTITPEGVVTSKVVRYVDNRGICGRRPEGLVVHAPDRSGTATSIAAWLAEAAHLEAASVVSFRRLERELRALGAPPALVTAARRSRADEIRHAREMTRLAHRYGGTPRAVVVEPVGARSPFEIALENAVEGCVRETFGALVAEYQGRAARDPEVRAVLVRIARDEARHAALAHDVSAWLEPRLAPRERAALARARAVALAELREELLEAPAGDVAELGGMPRPREALALLDRMEAALFTHAA
jgi:hypothetical protein